MVHQRKPRSIAAFACSWAAALGPMAFLIISCNEPLPMTSQRDPEEDQFFGPIPADFVNESNGADFRTLAGETARRIEPWLDAYRIPAGAPDPEAFAGSLGLLQPGANADAALEKGLPDPNACGGMRRMLGGYGDRHGVGTALTEPLAGLNLTGTVQCRDLLGQLGFTFPAAIAALDGQLGELNQLQLTGDDCSAVKEARWLSSKAAIGYEFIRKVGGASYNLASFDIPNFRGGFEGGADDGAIALRAESNIESRSSEGRYTRMLGQWNAMATYVRPGDGGIQLEKVENFRVNDWDTGRHIGSLRMLSHAKIRIPGGEGYLEEIRETTQYRNGAVTDGIVVQGILAPKAGGYALTVISTPKGQASVKRYFTLAVADGGCIVKK